MRATASRLAPLVVLLAVAGCSDAKDAVNDAASSANKAADCAALANDTLQSGVTDAQQLDPQDVQQAADRLSDRAATIDDADLRSAAQSLQDALGRVADAVAKGDTSALAKARTQAETAAREAAGECGIPVDRFTG